VNATSPKCETWQIDFPNSNLKAVKKSRQSEKVTLASRNTLRDPVKMVTRPIVVRNNVWRVLDIIWIKLIRHLKGENKWETFGTLDSNGLQI